MATIKTEGLDELMLSMKEVAELPDDVAEEMLQEGGKIVAAAQKRKYRTLLYNDKNLGKHLADSIKVSRMKRKRTGDTRYVTVYPQGTHNTYDHKGTTKKATNSEVAFVHEYGAEKRGIVAKGIMRAANEETAAEVTTRQYEIFDRHMKSKKL